MNHTTSGASSRHITRFTPFYKTAVGADHLFSINGGLSANDALNELVCFLGTAVDLIRDLACDLAEEGKDDHRAWSALYLSEISYAIAVASVIAVHTEDQGHD